MSTDQHADTIQSKLDDPFENRREDAHGDLNALVARAKTAEAEVARLREAQERDQVEALNASGYPGATLGECASSMLAEICREQDASDRLREALAVADVALDAAVKVHAAVNFDTPEDDAVRDKVVEMFSAALAHVRAVLAGAEGAAE